MTGSAAGSTARGHVEPARVPAEQIAPARSPTSFDRLRRAAADFWIRLLVWNAAHAPWFIRACKPVFVYLTWHVSPSLRDGTLANARRLLGEGSTPRDRAALGRAVVGHFYEFIAELGRNRGRTRRDLASDVVEVEGEERYLAARRLGRGAIVVTAHLGAFETGVAALRRREEKVHIVFRRDPFARFEALRSEQRRRLGVMEAPVDDGWAVWLRLREALRADEVVLMQGDRVMPGQKGVRVPFLGGHIVVPPGPVKLAIASGAPIVPVFALRSESGRLNGGGGGRGGVRIVMGEPIFADPDAPEAALLRIAAAIERAVRGHPDQWLMVHRVWCEDQGGGDPGSTP